VASAIAYAEESLRVARALGDYKSIGRALNILGNVLALSGQLEPAVQFYEESLAVARQHSDSNAVACVTSNLASTHIRRGEPGLAWPLIAEGIEACLADKYAMTALLTVVTELAAANEDWPWAARVLGAVQALREELGLPSEPNDVFWESIVKSIKRSRDGCDFSTAYDAGRALPAEDAVAEARAWVRNSVVAARA
jgi:tetratricopeptide (TPR) repeat protein